MDNLFYGCTNLLSLEINNFNFSKVNSSHHMFYGCNSLISLNFINFYLSNISNVTDFIEGCESILTYCTDNKEILLNNQLFSFMNNCTYMCFVNSQKKNIIEEIKCINDNCIKDDNYKVEFNNICYLSCPEETFNLSKNESLYENSEFITYLDFVSQSSEEISENKFIDLSDFISDSYISTQIEECNIKCQACSLESNENNLCISCNFKENYYPILKGNPKEDKYIDCFNTDPDGYYLDNINNIYMPCFTECNENKFINENIFNACIYNSSTNFLNCYEKCSYNYDKCYIKDMLYINQTMPIMNTYLNQTVYSYDINRKELKDIYTNITYIEIPSETLDYLYTKYNLDKEKDIIYTSIIDYPSNDSKAATNDYEYKFYLKNGTELYIEEDYYVDVYVPIKNLDLAKYNYSQIFAEQGYDIYDKESDFYNDICTSANLGENDLTLKDRKKDIYPNDVILCKNNCYYIGIISENERIICSCNLNINKEAEKTDDINDDLSEEYEDNFVSYLLDKINYKIFICYKLITLFGNLKRNYAFYSIIGIFFFIIILNLAFYCCTLSDIKNLMLEKSPTFESVKLEIIQQINKKKKRQIGINSKINPPKKKKKKKKGLKIKKIKIQKIKKNVYIKNNIYIKNPSHKRLIYIGKSKKKESDSDSCDDEINNLPYTKALIKDKRNIFKIFKSVLFEKLELIYILFGKQSIKLILLNEYILSLLINFFFNTLLYSDEIISNKYHNNGQLDFVVTLILSLSSNIITSIICYYIKYSKGIEERFERISEIKYEEHYIRNVNQYFRFLKIKFSCFFISELIIISSCFYYVVIFCIVYSCSKISLLINYLTSLLEGLIISVGITIIIAFTRVIGIKCFNKRLYNTSKYINDKY